jgi:hypothetical protein
MTAPVDIDQLLDSHAAASLLATSVRTLERWRAVRRPGSPPFIRLSEHAIRYSKRALIEWMRAKTVTA